MCTSIKLAYDTVNKKLHKVKSSSHYLRVVYNRICFNSVGPRVEASPIGLNYRAVVLNWRFCVNNYWKVTHTVQERKH